MEEVPPSDDAFLRMSSRAENSELPVASFFEAGLMVGISSTDDPSTATLGNLLCGSFFLDSFFILGKKIVSYEMVRIS